MIRFYKVKGDPTIGAISIDGDMHEGCKIKMLLGFNGRYRLVTPTDGRLSDLSERVSLSQTNDLTLTNHMNKYAKK